MKKTMTIFSHFVPILLLLGFGYFEDFSFSLPLTSLLLYGVCFLACPYLGICRLSPPVRGLLCAFAILSLAVGVPGTMILGMPFLAEIILGLGAVCFGTLAVFFALPKDSTEESHLVLRGLRTSHAHRTLFKKQSFAFFFQKSGVLFGLIAVYSLFIRNMLSPASLYSGALSSALISLLGILMYCVLGAPAVSSRRPSRKKGRYIAISLLVFILLLILAYIYVGAIYIAGESSVLEAIAAVKSLLTLALLSALLGFLLGCAIGYILSLWGAIFWLWLLRGFESVPYIFWVGLLLMLPEYTAFLLVPTFYATVWMLRARRHLLPFRALPITGHTKAVQMPLMHLANLSHLPIIFLSSISASICLQARGLSSLTELSFAIAAAMLSAIVCILWILCYLTKEVRQHA